MALNPDMNAALLEPAPVVFCAVEILLPGKSIRVLDGSGTVTFTVGGVALTFTGSDATFGQILSIEPLEESVGTQAPVMALIFKPSSNAALTSIANYNCQGSPVNMWFGVLNPATGQVLGQPELLFAGELDTTPLSVGRNSRTLQFEVKSAWERMFEANEGARLNNAFHQRNWPGTGERGFEYVTQVQRDLPWGYASPRSSISGGGGSGGIDGESPGRVVDARV